MLHMTIFCFNALENPIQVDREIEKEREELLSHVSKKFRLYKFEE